MYRHVECVEFECDGQCGAKRQVQADPRRAVGEPEMPPGWVEMRMTELAAKALHRSIADTRMHLCPSCFALVTLPLWNPARQVAMLSTLSEDELDDYDLDGIFEKAKRHERQRLAQEKQATP